MASKEVLPQRFLTLPAGRAEQLKKKGGGDHMANKRIAQQRAADAARPAAAAMHKPFQAPQARIAVQPSVVITATRGGKAVARSAAARSAAAAVAAKKKKTATA